ncbi:ammonium transporter family protein [Acuticoccus mangrovi]|uniref:Ammonium transporter n=1 Tax=Acuticoccus mangrovi TaxID=2796142 RepID=A0A934MEQ4_9HYPH|nr:ammonium transporter [Acuticoccus mangrovi]MBJ3777792.1 ammonium transporter [Acuticoccus mangrovi]
MKKQTFWTIAGAGIALAVTATAVWAQTETGADTTSAAPAVDAAASAAAAAPAAAAPAAEAAAAAAPAAPAEPSAFPFVANTFLFLVTGFLVMFMAAGFAMLEAGLVRAKNASMQCLKNIALYSIAGLMFWLLGYNLMYEGVDVANNIPELAGYLGTFSMKDIPAPSADTGDYAAASDWFFQMVFCATTASIVSGTVAERMRLWPFLIFTVFLTGILYPITGSWEWGAGWLDQMGFSDFAGSTLVHSVGGWAALAGAIVVGARAGKFGENGVIHPMPGSSIPLATLGTFILWLGWFGFNGGSQLALASMEDASSVAKIFVNTNTAAAAGVVVCVILTQLLYRKVDVTMALNGALGGLVSITAEPLAPTMAQAAMIGGIGGVLVVVFVPLLDRIHLDDVVGAIPVHLVCGIWGTMIVPLSNSDATYYVQFIGVISIGALAFFSSLILWLILAAVTGLRATPEEEAVGLDSAEVGILAYPEFGSQRA